MKALLTIDTDKTDKIDLLVRIAVEMGLKVERTTVADDLSFLISEPSLAEAWNSPEDARWDEAFSHLKR